MLATLQRGDGDVWVLPSLLTGARIRYQSGQRLQCRSGAYYGFHLDPVTEQHDVNQRHEFPEEVAASKTDHRGDAVDVSGGDGDADERHHAEMRVSLPVASRPERPAAVEIDHRLTKATRM